MRRMYATIDDFNQSDYVEDDNGDLLTVTNGRLRRASQDIDNLLLTAEYVTDDDGYPTEQPIIDALTAATCAQAAWGLITENTSGGQSVVGPISLGPLTLGSRTASQPMSTQTAQAVRVSPEAIQELRNAGWIPGQVWHQ